MLPRLKRSIQGGNSMDTRIQTGVLTEKYGEEAFNPGVREY